MAKRIQKEKKSQEREETPVEETPAPTEAEVKAKDTAALLDEIDEVLEVNAEEFVKSYIQKGGQ